MPRRAGIVEPVHGSGAATGGGAGGLRGERDGTDGSDPERCEMVETCLQLLELGYYEAKFAFEGLADENVWKRPAPGLLSVGELAGHIAFWEAVRLAGDGSDPAQCRVSSPLIDPRFRYYPATIATPPSEQHLSMTAEQVCRELLRVHEEAVAHFKVLNP